MAITPDGTRAYVTNRRRDTVSVIDTATNTVIGTPIPVGNSPVGVAVTPDGTRAYVTNQLDDTVSVIDTATNTVIATIPVGSRPDVAMAVMDIDAPTVTITSPADGATYTPAQRRRPLRCADEAGGSGLASCVGTVADGAAISTAALGAHTFSVTAIDQAGHETTTTVSYTVAGTFRDVRGRGRSDGRWRGTGWVRARPSR